MLHRMPTYTIGLLLTLLTIGAAEPAGAVVYRIAYSALQPVAQGLTVAHVPGSSRLSVTAGARPCWATDRRRGQYLLAVEAAALADAPRPAPLRVTVTYLDVGLGQWALLYQAWDGAQAQPLHSPVIQKRNTGAWREAEFTLSDFTGSRLAVDSFGSMVDEDDEYVAEIAVHPGGPAILGPPVLAAGEKHVLQAMYWNPDYQPRTWSLELRASAGSMQELVLTDGRPGDFEYTAPATPGPVVLEARLDQERSARRVLVWSGHSPLETESTLISPTGGPADWMYWPFAAQATLGLVPEEEEGSTGTSLAFNFTGPYWPGYVDLTRRTFLRGLPLELWAQVQTDRAGARLQAILEDASDQRFCYDLGPVPASVWTVVRGSLQGPTRYWGGAGDGIARFPLYFLSLRLVQGPEGSPASGKIRLRDVFVRTLAPTP